jgi:hypothetical protein
MEKWRTSPGDLWVSQMRIHWLGALRDIHHSSARCGTMWEPRGRTTQIVHNEIASSKRDNMCIYIYSMCMGPYHIHYIFIDMVMVCDVDNCPRLQRSPTSSQTEHA